MGDVHHFLESFYALTVASRDNRRSVAIATFKSTDATHLVCPFSRSRRNDEVERPLL